MRQLINIVTEARKPLRRGPPPIDTSGFGTEITALMRRLATICHMRFKRDWADQARASFAKRKAEIMSDADNEYTDQDWRYELIAVIDKLWEYHKDHLVSVRYNAAQAEEEYQQRAAERHNREDDPDFYIESSDYLRGMSAMVECAKSLNASRSLADPASAKKIIMQCQSFVQIWDDNALVQDGGEEPLIDEDFAYVIERLFPLMLLAFV